MPWTKIAWCWNVCWVSTYTVYCIPFCLTLQRAYFGRDCFRMDTWLKHSRSCDVDSVEDYICLSVFVKSFYFTLLFYMGAGWGYCMKRGWWLYIFMFLYHKIIWIISTLRSKHVYFDKTIQTYWALWSCKNKKKKFCNTKTLNLSEHRSVSVCAPLPPLPHFLPYCSCLLHLLLPSINL